MHHCSYCCALFFKPKQDILLKINENFFQETVDKADDFLTVLNQFEDWLKSKE